VPVWANVGLGPANAHVQRLPCSQALQHRSTEYGFEKSRMGRESDHGAAPGYMRGAEQVAPGCQRRRVKGDVSKATCRLTRALRTWWRFAAKNNTSLCPSARVPATSRLERKRLRKALMRLCPAPRHTSHLRLRVLTCADCACAQRHGAVSLRSPANPQSTPVEKIVDCLGSHGRSQH
jgi:hypothetical protein